MFVVNQIQRQVHGARKCERNSCALLVVNASLTLNDGADCHKHDVDELLAEAIGMEG